MENETDWGIALQGLERFFDEGMTLWSKDKFYSLFTSEEVARSDYVLSKIIEFEQQGIISFVGTDELYIKVVQI